MFVTTIRGPDLSGVLGAGGTITDLKPFAAAAARAWRSDRTVAVSSPTARFSSRPNGKEVGRIDVPERPLQLLFGGTDRRTLFILTHHALYSTRP